MENCFKRILAYVIDICLINLITAVLYNIPPINNYTEEYVKLDNEYREVVKEFEKEKIEEKEYENKITKINYEMGKSNVLTASITVSIIIIYFGVAQFLLNGQTFGKKIMKLRIVGNKDRKLNIGNYLIRCIILNNVIFRIMLIVGVYLMGATNYHLYSTIIGIIESVIESAIFVMIALRTDGRGLHDMIAGTKVIYVGEADQKIVEAKVVEKKNPKKKKSK